MRTQKNATPSQSQQLHIRAAGLDPAEWVVLHDLRYSMILEKRDGSTCRVIEKNQKLEES